MVVAPSIPLADSDTLVRVSGVSKKFCLSLKKSLWYGLCDMGRELTGRRRGSGKQGSEGDDRAGLRPKEFWAVNNVSFELKRGECLGLIGRNGAGKTTLLKMLNGLIKPDAGRIEMRGRVGALIALGAGFNPILTGRENIYVNGSVLGLSKKEIDAKLDEIIDFAEIGDFIDTPVQNYSSGMAVRLGFAVASSISPDVLLIDEVLAVGDMSFVFKCFNRIADILPKTAIVFVSHSMPLISRVCTSAMVMERGCVEYQGGEVPHAIELYSTKASTIRGEMNNVGGTEISLEKIGLRSQPDVGFDYSGNLHLANGTPLDIRLELKSNVSTSLAFSPFIKILDQQLREAIDVIPFFSEPMCVIHPKTKTALEVHLDAVYLSRGKHSIVVGAFDPKTKRNYARINNCAEFYAEAGYHGWATNTMPGKWSQMEPLVT